MKSAVNKINHMNTRHFIQIYLGLTVLLTLAQVRLSAQETVKVVDKKHKEIYYVLKSDKKVRQGPYCKLGCNDSAEVEGFYKNGLKDSIWTGWPASGVYVQGRKTGVWVYYNFMGQLEQKYDHSTNELLYWRFCGTPDSLYFIYFGDDSTKVKLERPPLYIGGEAVQLEPILALVRIPWFTLWLHKNYRKIIINFTVDSSGKTSDYRVTKGISASFDKKLLKALQGIPQTWLPAIQNGKPVSKEHNFMMSFYIVHRHKK